MANTIAPGATSEDLYRPGSLLPFMRQYSVAPSFLRDNFFPIEDISDTDSVIVDYEKGNNLLAPFVNFYAKGSTVIRDRYRTSTFKPPKIAPILPLTADDLLRRQGGSLDVTDEADLLLNDLNDLDQRIGRTEEWMCSQCLFTGTVPITDFDSGKVIATLQYDPPIETVVGKPWTDPTSDPLGDLRASMRVVGSTANLIADLIVFGGNAATLFENHPTVKDAYNKLFIQIGVISPQMKEWNVTTLGTYRGIPLLVDETQYKDKTGATQFYVNPDMVLVACSQNKGRMAYAGVGQKNEDETNLVVFSGKRIPLVWFPEDSDSRKLRLSSRPCPVPPDASNWTLLNVS